MNTKKLTRIGLVAAIYVVLTWILPMFSYGPIQFRISEILTLLAFYNPIYVLSITIGAFISNIISPLGIIDMFVGALHSFLSVYAMTKTKNIYLASIFPALFSFIIAIEILIVSDEKLSFFLNYRSNYAIRIYYSKPNWCKCFLNCLRKIRLLKILYY